MSDRSIRLSMGEFLRLMGLAPAEAKRLAIHYEPVLLRSMLSMDMGASVGRHPLHGPLVFDRDCLNAWWVGTSAVVLSLASTMP